MSTTNWSIDTTHSEVQFKVKHLVISTLTGTFSTFEGNVKSDSDDFNNAKVNFSIDVDSINTNNADRDGHLKSDDFFSSAKYPKIAFTEGILKKTGAEHYELHGQISIRDVKKPIVLEVSHGGTAVDPWGNTKAGFEINGTINRKEFGLTWSAATEAGGLVVGDDVKLLINVELTKG